MKWYKDPILWIIVIRGIVIIVAFLLLVWLAATVEIEVTW